MDLANENLKADLKKLNDNLKDSLYKIENFDRESIRKRLEEIGSFVHLKKLSSKQLKVFKPIAVIDGSVNRFGASHPHYVDLFQALSKISGQKPKSHFKSDIFSPLINPSSEDEDEDLRNKLLAKIEVDVAIETIYMEDVKFILMDGNLIRYSIRTSETYKELKTLCEDRNILLAGFIKEAKSNLIFELIYPEVKNFNLYDKDLLYGVLDSGEGFVLNKDYDEKLKRGISSMILRTSNYPGVAGLEILESQSVQLENIANLCYSLTSEMSRGVPMIIDMVDKEVKLDDKLTKELILAHIDRDLIERFLASERSMRRY